MSLRLLSCSLLLITLAVFRHPLVSQGAQPPRNPPIESSWEYKVVRLDANQCALESELAASLNWHGQQGWELVNYDRSPFSFPRDAEGALLLKPAATDHGALTTPQTADSFQGTITLKMAPAQAGACRLLFKREWRQKAR